MIGNSAIGFTLSLFKCDILKLSAFAVHTYKQLDDIDYQILKVLQEDSKLTAKQIGEMISRSQTPVYLRIKKLEQKGVIKQYVAILDDLKLNKRFKVVLQISTSNLSNKDLESFKQELRNQDEIQELYLISGHYNLLAKASFTSIEEYRMFLIEHIYNKHPSALVECVVDDTIRSSTAINI